MAKKDIKTLVIDAARELFFKHGFKRINIEDICNKATISRKTFYVYFDNKVDLLLQLLEHQNQIRLKKEQEILAGELPFADKMFDISEYHISQLEMITEDFLADIFDPSMVEVKKYFDIMTEAKRDSNIKMFKEAQLRGDIREDVDVDFFQYYFSHIMEFHKNPSIQKLYPDRIQLLRKMNVLVFYGILGK